MKDITTTSFGLVIAYLLPGFLGLYSLSFWSLGLRKMFGAFLTAQSTVGLFLLVVVAALVVGLLVNSLRWAIYESWRRDGLKPDELAKLGTNPAMLPAYLQRIDENFRYHQFSGGASVVLPILYLGWLSTSWTSLGCYLKLGSLLAVLIIELVTICVAVTGYRRYLNGSRMILKG